MEKTPYQIYDIIFKKILTLSATAVINLINGLFDTNYSPDSIIRYNWTEFADDKLRKVLADTIITINGCHSYHMEAQMTEDDDIVFRVFDYGYGHAFQNNINTKGSYILKFPEPKIIYLYYDKPVPDEYTLTLDFGTQGTFNYKVSTFKFLDTSIEELNKNKMVILIPFALLKLRKILAKERSQENLDALKSLIQNDIMESIDVNEQASNITKSDAVKLRNLTHKLYDHIYSHYEEMKELNDMTDETIMFDIDIIEKEFEQKLDSFEQKIDSFEQKLTEKEHELAAKENELLQKDNELTAKKDELLQKDNEIARLKKQLEALQKK